MKDKLDNLFAGWMEDYPFDIFCKDGVVRPDIYKEEEIRVLFVLKDPNVPKAEREHICREFKENSISNKEKVPSINKCVDVLEEKEGGRTWNPIAVWAKGLLEDTINSTKSFDGKIRNGWDFRKRYLSRIAFLNLKKEAGEASACDECVKSYSRWNKNKIIEEIKICDPDVIVACNSSSVYYSLKEYIFPNHEDAEPPIKFGTGMKEYGHWFDVGKSLGLGHPVFVIEYCHPNRSGKFGDYKDHYNNMQEIRKFMLNNK